MYRCTVCNGPLGTGDTNGVCSSCKRYHNYSKDTHTNDNYYFELDELNKLKENIEKRIKELENDK